jgi:hypothetical protein
MLKYRSYFWIIKADLQGRGRDNDVGVGGDPRVLRTRSAHARSFAVRK